MVATLSALKNVVQATSYYEAGDDYYAESGKAPSAWQGKGAKALGLSGAVDRDQFAKLLAGEVAGQKLGTVHDGEWSHRPGWDLTFSAPKSVSILAEVAGDQRLVEAHQRAVQTALGLAETHFAATRIRDDGSIRREATGSLVIASFDHSTSRALDPQLHTHNVILNMTQDGDTAQLGSIEAGAAFGQLQVAGMQTARLTKILRQTNEQAREAVEASLAGDAKRAMAALESGGGRIVEQDTREARFAQIARDYAALDEMARKRTLVIEPSREGRDRLTKDIREELVKSGALSGPVLTATRLVPKDLTKAEAKDARSYAIGDTIRFAKDYADKGVTKTEAYRVAAINPDKAAIALEGEDGRPIDWRLRQWGASHAHTFTAEPIELRAGDQVQFTRNDRSLGRINGQQGEIIAVDPEGRLAKLKLASGGTKILDLDKPQDRHIAHGYVATAFAAQGRTVDQVLVHAESTATHLIDQKSFYVAISRSRLGTAIYTDDRFRLVNAIQERSGAKQVALAEGGGLLEQERSLQKKTFISVGMAQHVLG